ncbi:MAG: translation initiation factor IF-2 [Deltaproteobacteria bacterium]|jgi:translation initiation factor IF-2|nr:translation initiation factor IF-2 [Deltaproteobacteria bacterium]
MGKKRIHELAKELSLTSAELLQRMNDLKILPGNKLGPSHSIDDDVAEMIRTRITGLMAASPTRTVIRRRKKGGDDIPEAQSPSDGQESRCAPEPLPEAGTAEQARAPEPGEAPAAPREPAPATGEETGQAPRPVKVPQGRYDKATIVGVQQQPARPPDPARGAPARAQGSPSQERAPQLPDFMRLSPTGAQAAEPPAPQAPPETPARPAPPEAETGRQPPQAAAPAAAAGPDQAPGQAPAGAEAAEAAGTPPAPGADRTEQRRPEARGSEEAPRTGAQRPQGPGDGQQQAGRRDDRRPQGERAQGERRPAEGQQPGQPGQRGKVTRELGQPSGSPLVSRGQRPQVSTHGEPAKVVGVVTSFSTGPDGSRPYTSPDSGGYGRTGPARPYAGRAGGPGGPRTFGDKDREAGGPNRPPRGPGGPPRGPGGPPRGPRPDAGGPPPQGDAPSRKRGDRKKKPGGAFADKGHEETRGAKKRELVERTDLYSEGSWERARGKRPKVKKSQAKTEITTPKAIKRRIKVDEVITVSELAHRLSLKAGDIIKKLMGMGVMAGLNQSLDFDTATLVAAEFGYDVERSAFDEGEFLPMPDVDEKYPLATRSPVVTIMGHVDHGKTSLLDYVRKTKIQEGEAGGITQHIGAYHVRVGGRYITFLDTPGHEAFTAMRSRGAQVTDIVILIVAADDGVMPQTREAADHAKAARVPIIVAVNKIDKPGADAERIRRQLTDIGLTQEAWGGDTVFVDISAKTGQGVEELLEMILLQADILDLKARADGPARGRIIDARLDKGRGAMATVLVGEGSLKMGDAYVCGVHHGKIRAMFTDQGSKIEEAGPSIPVEIQGISGVPLAGDEFIVMENDKQARQVSQHRLLKQRESVLVKTSKLTLENLFDHIKAGAVKGLNLILKADVQGSLEAILDAVGKFSNPEIKITVIHSSIGLVTETDIMLASASNALIICFGVKPPAAKVQEVAESEQVQIRYYDVIYKLLDDIKEAMAGLLDPVKSVKVIGQVEVRQVFNISKVGLVAGCYVTDGKVSRGARAKLVRNKETIFDGRVATLKREKNDVREVLAGYECGLSLDGYSAVQQGDRLEVYQIEETAATVDLINEAMERSAAEAAKNEAARQSEAGAGS